MLRAFASAPVAGALYVLATYVSCNLDPLVPADEVLLGKSANRIAEFMAVRFAPEIRHIGLSLALMALGFGLVLGLVALALFVLRDAARGQRRPRTGFRAALEGLAIVIVLHAGTVGASMACWPALYTRNFYSHGGIRALVEVIVADSMGAAGVAGAVLGAAVLYVLGLPSKWPAVVMRIGAKRAAGGAGALAIATVALWSVDRGPLAVPRPPARRSDKRPNVLVLAADGLRNDRVVPATAPRLSAVADRGTRFDRAYVSVPRTLCSWTTMLTGLYAHHHGIRSAFPRPEEVHAHREALPARLRDAGWFTAAVSDYAGDVFRKLDYGFTSVRAPRFDVAALLWQRAFGRSAPLLPLLQTSAGRAMLPAIADWPDAADPRFVADDAIAAMREANGRPFFLVVFFSTTHSPYAVPEPWQRKYTDPGYAGDYRYDKQVSVGVVALPDPVDVKQIRGLYDGSVAAVDAAAGTVFDELSRQGLADDTIVVVTSDHGEMLFENDRWQGHGDMLFGDEAVHMPLAIYDPRTPRARHESAMVSSVDLAPTLYELTGVAGPTQIDGRSLAAAVRGETIESRAAFAETELWLGANPALPPNLHIAPPPLFDLFEVIEDGYVTLAVRAEAAEANVLARHRMIRDERWKLVYMPTPKGVAWRLFDLERDPNELRDVKDENPEVFAHLREALFAWILEDPHLSRDGDALRLR
jgi:arylsulfatase A-like enzyme